MPTAPEKRWWPARLIRWVLGIVYYWADLYGEDSRPSNAKVVYTGTLIVMLVGWSGFGWKEIGVTEEPLSASFLWLTALVMAFAFGKHTFNGALAWLSRGKLGDAVVEQERQRSSVIGARSDAIAERRRASSAEHDGTEATE